MSNFGSVMDSLWKIVEERKKALPEDSYTARLIKKGKVRVFQKVGEEAVETLLALAMEDREKVIYEVADLLYHLTVALSISGVSWNDVGQELAKRMK